MLPSFCLQIPTLKVISIQIYLRTGIEKNIFILKYTKILGFFYMNSKEILTANLELRL